MPAVPGPPVRAQTTITPACAPDLMKVYEARSVSREEADALELLSEFDFIGAIPRTPTQSQALDAPRSKAAMFLEMLFMGWFVPARRAAPPDDANDAAVEDDTDPPEKS